MAGRRSKPHSRYRTGRCFSARPSSARRRASPGSNLTHAGSRPPEPLKIPVSLAPPVFVNHVVQSNPADRSKPPHRVADGQQGIGVETGRQAEGGLHLHLKLQIKCRQGRAETEGARRQQHVLHRRVNRRTGGAGRGVAFEARDNPDGSLMDVRRQMFCGVQQTQKSLAAHAWGWFTGPISRRNLLVPCSLVIGADPLLDLRISDHQEAPALHISAARRADARFEYLPNEVTGHRVRLQPAHRPRGLDDLEQIGGIRGFIEHRIHTLVAVGRPSPNPYADHVGCAIKPEPPAIDLWLATGSTYKYFNVMRLVATEAATGSGFVWSPASITSRSRRARRRLPRCGATSSGERHHMGFRFEFLHLTGKKFGSHQLHCFVGIARGICSLSAPTWLSPPGAQGPRHPAATIEGYPMRQGRRSSNTARSGRIANSRLISRL